MMVLVCFLLTACGCKHEETVGINAKPATCTEGGSDKLAGIPIEFNYTAE